MNGAPDLAAQRGAEPVPPPLTGNVSRGPVERAVGWGLAACALVTVATTLGIVGVLVWESVGFFRQVPITEFFGATEWTPLFVDGQFGVWPLVAGTLLVTAIAAAVALPLGLLAAVYVSQFASSRVRRVVKPALELLAGVPDRRRLRLLRADGGDALFADVRPRARRLQRALGRARGRGHDPPARPLP